jgi:hypothetical protein
LDSVAIGLLQYVEQYCGAAVCRHDRVNGLRRLADLGHVREQHRAIGIRAQNGFADVLDVLKLGQRSEVEIMAAWRRAIELLLGDEDTAKLRSIAQSRTEPASRVERARILLAYPEAPSFYAVGRALGLYHQTVQRCVERAVVEGAMAARPEFSEPATWPLRDQPIRTGAPLGTARPAKSPSLAETARAMALAAAEGLKGIRDRALLLLGLTS